MALEILGKVVKVLDVQRGEGKNGPWVRGGFVIETLEDNFPKKVCLDVWSDKISDAQRLVPGDTVRANIEINSREYNGRWYTNVRAWRFEKTESGSGGTVSTSTESGGGTEQFNPSPESDDLPF